MDTTPHVTTLVIGSGTGPDGGLTADMGNIQGEHCMRCWLDGDEGAPTPTPCALAQGHPLTVGTLVQPLPAPRWHRVPARTGVVLLEAGALSAVWFWTLGPVELGRTVHTVETGEVAPMVSTLADLPLPALLELKGAVDRDPNAAAVVALGRIVARIPG
ncbi:hypothetical protein ABT357_27090 [Streptomyces albidoflavus]|uniref:hypothetical protein n=1 Tax=Streptomyces albidoflavus TaxID=1886 RepID=UPI00331BAA6B